MGTSITSFRTARRAALAAPLLALWLCTPTSVAAQASSNGRSEAIILRPLSFFKIDDLDFGSIIPSTSSSGTVRLQPNGTRTATGGIILVGNTAQPARFTGLGTSGQLVSISMQANTIWLNGPGPQMRARTWEIGSTPTTILSTSPLRFRITSATGAFAFPLGATLEVGANQPEGEYSGTFTINLNYL